MTRRRQRRAYKRASAQKCMKMSMFPPPIPMCMIVILAMVFHIEDVTVGVMPEFNEFSLAAKQLADQIEAGLFQHAHAFPHIMARLDEPALFFETERCRERIPVQINRIGVTERHE